MERFLFRLSVSPHGERFVLKGALMLATWEISLTRPTSDIDLLGNVANDVDRIVTIVKEVCRQEVEPDGLEFNTDTVMGARIAEEAEYEGVRVRFRGNLGTARVSMQIDVGFGDAVVPAPVMVVYPTLLDLPAPRVRAYTRESVIAEKFHTMVRRGILNSRMRDFFDVWSLSRRFDFDGGVLAAAIRETFARRGQDFVLRPAALTDEFAADLSKAAQWRGFLRKNLLWEAPSELKEVIQALSDFLGPVAEALHEGREFRSRWRAPGPWSEE
ncbi:MAG: nucleotidyl transferase AbiEii/AbiGii toxin family protein [Candidatus Eisenbacteria bacterium]|uniref:Nucleotidyl transferase AbiEii/AbiGii toxin family protein n=1 Tax=Eiseniibacteriota bacterium TaxID=2212470 RepID=A0A948WDI8_UNCEI|nr:nucleotidyl transferase AbiEii/AbiGii toxin family protein [Candidatus Eisenbacteria bacterium]MBU1947900.1 nucleotidyl transferase AbiEii/AbiGii toxin family protein [Candidatus Eisenbacteria bacterium]MBU2691898.1 nucleotidyl transferase AbiEii/AbiGii toxin family protein [Candidatus Eisenbacteria bacterium]